MLRKRVFRAGLSLTDSVHVAGRLLLLVGVSAFTSSGCATAGRAQAGHTTDCKSLVYEPSASNGLGGEQVPAPEGMVFVPGGTFEMGVAEEDLKELVEMGRKVPHMSPLLAKWWFGDETPAHTVDVSPFYLDVHEVTNQRFRQFASETGYKTQGNWERHASGKRAKHPVVNVTWHDARAYCEWAGKRLPSEAEWEYAAKGGKDVKWFPWGDTPDGTCANYRYAGETILTALFEWGRVKTKAVGSYAPNGYGLYDMCGNVREWCENERRPYPGGPQEEWIYTRFGPFREDEKPVYGRAARGGSWDSPNAVFVRLNERGGRTADTAATDLGFRCAQSID